jgi:hypothetical protein
MMATRKDTVRATSDACGSAVLELHLSQNVFAAGQHLSGVVVFRLPKLTHIRSLTINVTGQEAPAGTALARTLRRASPFFERDELLSGMGERRFTSERVSQFWNAFLGRDLGRTLSAGEHIYPFSIPLPASLPGTYDGKAGRITYTIAARAQFPMGRAVRAASDVQVRFVPRAQRGRPVALSYPNTNGTTHESEVGVDLQLPDRAIPLGEVLSGRFTISNPQRARITEMIATLETCEWIRSGSGKKIQRTGMDTVTIAPEDPEAAVMEYGFELKAPADAPPTLEGTAISVIWLLKLNLDTSPPLELKTPITVYAPLPSSQA